MVALILTQKRRREAQANNKLSSYSPQKVPADYQTAIGGIDTAYQNLKRYADPVVIRSFLDATLNNRVSAKDAAAEMRLIALAELRYGNGDAAKAFRQSDFPLQATLSESKFPGMGLLSDISEQLSSLQERYIKGKLGTVYGTYVEADALRAAFGRATGMEMDVNFYSSTKGKVSKPFSLRGDSSANKKPDLTLNIHNADNDHFSSFSSGGNKPEITSGHNNNCLFHAFRQELVKHKLAMLNALDAKMSPAEKIIAPTKQVSTPMSIVTSVPQKPAVVKPVKPLPATFVSAMPKPVIPTSLVADRPAAPVKPKPAAPVVARPKNTPLMAPQPVSTVAKTTRPEARVQQSRNVLTEMARADLNQIVNSGHERRISAMIADGAMTDNTAESQRLQRLAETPAGRLQLVQIQLDRMVSSHYQMTGNMPQLNVMDLARKIVNNEKIDQAKVLEQFGQPSANNRVVLRPTHA